MSVREVILHDHINCCMLNKKNNIKKKTQVDQRIAGIQPLNKRSEINL